MFQIFLNIAGLLLLGAALLALTRSGFGILDIGIGLIGILCFAVASALHRLDEIERYLRSKDSEEGHYSSRLNIPDHVEAKADKLRAIIAKKTDESVVVDTIYLHKNEYHISLLIGQAANTRKKTALIPMDRADNVSVWQNAAAEMSSQL